ncbi:hypothetical protein ACFV5N_00790 [Streptomyces sp. NPDC059853]|uniref:hypothetical protein n=1 Tax=Streptomyces sp. NPDC059853 TaxID=3346973 RepID=UPI0036561361
MTTDQLTYGGGAVALGIITVFLILWWVKDNHKITKALGIAALLSVGALFTVCTGGLLGLAAGVAAQGTNQAGRIAAGGTGALDGDIATASTQQLTGGAAIILVVLLAAFAINIYLAKKSGDMLRMARNVLLPVAGAALAFSAGGAEFLNDHLYSWLNDSGQPLDDWLNGA